MKNINLISLITFTTLLFSACKTTTQPKEGETDSIFPMYIDENANNINDFVEQGTHNSGFGKAFATDNRSSVPVGAPGHPFVDENNDGICDFAQNGSPTWHGPGFIDNNDNGICDYWDQSLSMHQQYAGMQFHDENQDGICDYAQDGSPTWHGPGFVDNDSDGICDYWEEGGMGYHHGGMHHGS